MAFTSSWSLHAPETVIHFELVTARARDRDTRPRAQRPNQEKLAAVDERLSPTDWKRSPAAKNGNKNHNLERSPVVAAKIGAGKINRASNFMLRMRPAKDEIWPQTRREAEE
jgi:hypothetical protein